MKMKNKSLRFKINLIFLVAIIIMMTSSIFFSSWLSNNYGVMKINNAWKYYHQNPQLETSQYLEYLNKEGFVVTISDEQGNYQGRLSDYPEIIQKPKKKPKLYFNAQTISFESNQRRYTISINENISNDIIKIMVLVTAVLVGIFSISLVITNFLLTKIFVKKIEIIKDYLHKLENKEKIFLEYESKDEIGLLLDKINGYNDKINKNTEDKKNLINTFAHELKTPLSRIEAINFLYQNRDLDYPDFSTVDTAVQKEIIEMKALISEALDVFDNADAEILTINVQNVITKILKRNESLFSTTGIKIALNIKELFFKGNEIYFELLIKNVVSNIVKHADSKKVITIKSSGNEVSFANYIRKSKKEIEVNQLLSTKNSSQNKSHGNKLIDKLAKQLDIKVEREKNFEKYIVTLTIPI